MRSNLFRQQATESITSPERVNDYVRVTRSSFYLLMAALLVCVLAAGLWVSYGKVNDYVKVSAVVFPHDGVVKTELRHQGVVTEVYARRGDFVREGERLLRYGYEGSFGYLTAPCTGIVLSGKGENESFQAFESCVYLFPQGAEGEQLKELKAFVGFKELRKLKVGMEVQVSPGDLPREEFGYIVGSISEIAVYPTARAEAERHFRSSELLENVFPKEGAAFEVKIALKSRVDAHGKEQLQWSHRIPEEADMRIGTFCDIQILTKSRSIIDLLFKDKQ